MVSRSLTHISTLTRVHAFATSRIDCCSSLLVGLPHWYLSPVGPTSTFSCPSCWKTAQACVQRCVLRCSSSSFRDLCCPVSVLTSRRCCVLLRGVRFWSLRPI